MDAMLDPKTSKRRLVACARCRSPIASSAWSGTVVLKCGKCNHEETRSMTLAAPSAPSAEKSEVPYRDSAAPREAKGTPLVASLDKAPAGRSTNKIDDEVLRDALERVRNADEEVGAFEWDRVWCAVWLAFKHASLGRTLDARVTLETVLETVRTPAYRALLLATLAQHAASIGAPGLARKWLKARPDAPIAEIESAVNVARALIAYAKDEHEDVVHITGDRRAGSGFHENDVILAIALNIESNARAGRKEVADAIIRDCARKGMLEAVVVTMRVFGISDASVLRVARRGRVRATWIPAVGSAAVFAFAATQLGQPLGRVAASGLLSIAASAGFGWWSSVWATETSPGKKVLSWVGAIACVILPMLWLTHALDP